MDPPHPQGVLAVNILILGTGIVLVIADPSFLVEDLTVNKQLCELEVQRRLQDPWMGTCNCEPVVGAATNHPVTFGFR